MFYPTYTWQVNLQIWDTAGQERFRSMAPMYYRGAKAALCVFDITNEDSFEKIADWLRDLKCHADSNCVICIGSSFLLAYNIWNYLFICFWLVCIAANKCDKTPSFELTRCEEYAKSIGAAYYQTSALSGENVHNIFNKLSQQVYKIYSGDDKESADFKSGRRLGREQEASVKHEPYSCCWLSNRNRKCILIN